MSLETLNVNDSEPSPDAAGGSAAASTNGVPSPAIEFRDVYLAFDDQVILDHVSFSVRRGETKIVLGGSGSGKSTIINLVLGLLKPDAGQILVEGGILPNSAELELMRIRKRRSEEH